MGKRKEVHVVPNSNRGGWDVQKNGAERVSKHFGNKKDALDWARDLAKKNNAELIPHGKDGQIQNPDSHGPDPCPPLDKK